ncbi:MAG: hypothetical protein AAGD25_28725 [Cyanobacteria bacterium P01_F01_bin.150]
MKRTLIIGFCAALLAIVLTTAQSILQPTSNSSPTVAQEVTALAPQPVPEFGDYWYKGEAEITSYSLEQARYGEIHNGQATLVFVTEPFSKRKQVKLDYPDQNRNDEVSVLKLNTTKKFNTGIYPYSMMSSIFSPVDLAQYPHALKLTTSSQEWCGQTFLQLNNQDQSYEVDARSYFEQEGDERLSLDKTWLEDELWTRLRMNPDALPVGKVSMIPSTFYTRLRHTDIGAVEAIATFTNDATNPQLKTYTLEYPSQSRTLSIYFESSFPYAIQGWEESYPSGFGASKMLTTKATAINRIMSDYWAHNRNADLPLREELGLPL